MREPFTQLYFHLVWATWDRLPLLSPELLEVVDRAIRRECVDLGVEVEAFGGVADHVHLLVRIPTTVSVSQVVKQIKGASSHLINQRLEVPFKWQGGYGAFSVSRSLLPKVRDYVLKQEQHHQYGTIFPAAELPRRAACSAREHRGHTSACSPRRRTSCRCCSEFIRPFTDRYPRWLQAHKTLRDNQINIHCVTSGAAPFLQFRDGPEGRSALRVNLWMEVPRCRT